MAADSNAERMTAYLDDALEGDDASSFEAWLEDSPDAKKEVEDLQRLLSVVRELPDVEAPPDFYDKVAKKIRRSRGPDPNGMNWSLVSMPFQVLSVIIIMVIAATYLMLELDRDQARIEKDPSAAKAQEKAERARDAAQRKGLE
ncbi:hypothetical protein PPSIR1_32934 [Plesiocystis pacifica SIR-1]|uniref:Anti-sigma factor n=1 Tax=Plesiocystis pacifica SIR-1 TaxID=391625 RepID=A6GDP7_9BACT|nr:hypothetical protein [Plesiocystis pacifica]EDM76022.1 hypothetical protein PPSIR1_32934 [Plesiocystis pacifica SIR-1]